MSKKILIADDDKEFVEILSERLTSVGYDTVIAYEGIRALQLAHHKKPDLIILDWKMPVGLGSVVLKDLKNAPDTKHIPIVILTGLDDTALEVTAKQLGADAFFRKPYNTQEFLLELKELLAIAK
ncbi:MAG: hypothetical protein COV46_07690 [Deltaproteobacteria bacterium CG11_big_fil_rev_8_21_14_0_20_49_13]|nr:MAG: hypothetical protein COV46_07690 [Deltaproteobacteria bacterium CG11_big_fil_rev_8_21_14_0_20_49_13]